MERTARFMFLVAVLARLAAPGLGQTTVEERYERFQNHLKRRAAAVTRAFPGSIGSLEEWKRRRPELRRQVLDMLGLDPMPARTPLRARVTGRIEREGYRVEKVVFQSMPGLYVTGNLYLPARAAGRLPAVLYLCGHSPGPWGAKVRYQHHGIWFARHGYVALLIDTLEFGEVPGLHHGTHDLEMWDWLSLGYTPAGPETWNAIRALDYLETRPEVDASRVAVTGISGGGGVTWYAAAADERFRVAVPVCGTWTAEHHAALDAVHENCDCIYLHSTYLLDLPAVGALIAPRPVKILSARRDSMFPVAGYREVFQRVRPVYNLFGAGDKLAEYDHDAPHSDIPAFRKEGNEWINRWLRSDPTPFEEGRIQREPPEVLKVLDRHPADAINGHIHKVFIPAHRPAAPKTLGEWRKRRAALLGELKDKSLRAFPPSKAPFHAWKAQSKDWTANYSDPWQVEFDTEEDIRVRGQLYLPRGSGATAPALVYVKGRGDVVYPVDYDPLLAAFPHHTVLTLHPRAVEYPMTNYKLATLKRTAALAGATFESMQAWDILRSIDYLTEEAGRKPSLISLYARREMTVPAIYAAALDARIGRLILEDPPTSHWQGPALLNVLRFTDLPEALGLVAPREIVWLTPMPAPYQITETVYRLHGSKDKMRRAFSLSDALKVWEQP